MSKEFISADESKPNSDRGPKKLNYVPLSKMSPHPQYGLLSQQILKLRAVQDGRFFTVKDSPVLEPIGSIKGTNKGFGNKDQRQQRCKSNAQNFDTSRSAFREN